MMTDSVMLTESKMSKSAGGTGTIITSTLAIRHTGRIKSCQRANHEGVPAVGNGPVAIRDSGTGSAKVRKVLGTNSDEGRNGIQIQRHCPAGLRWEISGEKAASMAGEFESDDFSVSAPIGSH